MSKKEVRSISDPRNIGVREKEKRIESKRDNGQNVEFKFEIREGLHYIRVYSVIRVCPQTPVWFAP